MCLQNLPNVHPRWHTNRIEDDINRSTIGQEGHILFGGNEGNDTLVAVTSGQLITHGNLSFLGDPYLNPFVNPGGQVITAVLSGVYSHIDNLAPFAVWNTQRGIFHITGLFAEYRSQQLLLGGKLRLAAGSDFADQCIIGTDFGTDADNAVLIELTKALLANIGDIPGNFLRAQFGITGFHLMLGNVN